MARSGIAGRARGCHGTYRFRYSRALCRWGWGWSWPGSISRSCARTWCCVPKASQGARVTWPRLPPCRHLSRCWWSSRSEAARYQSGTKSRVWASRLQDPALARRSWLLGENTAAWLFFNRGQFHLASVKWQNYSSSVFKWDPPTS